MKSRREAESSNRVSGRPGEAETEVNSVSVPSLPRISRQAGRPKRREDGRGADQTRHAP